MDEESLNTNSLNKLFNTVLKYSIIFPIVIYFIGFIFTTGFLGAFVPNSSPFETLTTAYCGFLPFSKYLYISNGIIYSITLILCTFISMILYYSLYNFYIEDKFPFVKRVITSDTFLIIGELIPIIICCSLVAFMQYKWFTFYHEILYNAMLIFSQIIIYKVINLRLELLEKTKTNDQLVKARSDKYNLLLHKFYIFILIFFTIIISTYIWGVQTLDKKLSLYESGARSFTFAKVTTINNLSKTYYYLDTTSDSFIGFTATPYSLVVIPKSQISKLDIFQLNKEQTYEKYSFTKQESKDDINEELETTVKEYYESRFINKDYKKFASLLSKSYLQEKYHLSIDTLIKSLEKNSKYSDRDISEYINYESSIPVKFNDSYQINVIEYWVNDRSYSTFFLKKENDSWKISKINLSNQPFSLVEK
ncbi:hypothetical protein [Candidatus Clostridium radicumherbarum]|uniref:DUF4829 domain-containing protein n=1 Tax=Candidatus Clostridium radicumherbarum TaxID=3381662 RepID=A0ABW8TVW4_9CLOT